MLGGFRATSLDQAIYDAFDLLIAVAPSYKHGISRCHNDQIVDANGGHKAALAADEIVPAIFDEHVSGVVLEQTAGGWRFATRADHDSILKKYFAKKGENRLTIAALETLAIIGYRQPMTAPEISDIRGVNSTSSIRTLLERRMIRVAGRKNVVGSPFLYRTTKEFLVHFGLNDIRDLPRLEEFGDLIGESLNEEVVAAINNAPEPDFSAIVEETESGTALEAEMMNEEVELESSGSDRHE